MARRAPDGGEPRPRQGAGFATWIEPPVTRGGWAKLPGSWRAGGWASGPGRHPEPSEAMEITAITHGKPGRAPFKILRGLTTVKLRWGTRPKIMRRYAGGRLLPPLAANAFGLSERKKT
jgi:hypothetical protein